MKRTSYWEARGPQDRSRRGTAGMSGAQKKKTAGTDAALAVVNVEVGRALGCLAAFLLWERQGEAYWQPSDAENPTAGAGGRDLPAGVENGVGFAEEDRAEGVDVVRDPANRRGAPKRPGEHPA